MYIQNGHLPVIDECKINSQGLEHRKIRMGFDKTRTQGTERIRVRNKKRQ